MIKSINKFDNNFLIDRSDKLLGLVYSGLVVLVFSVESSLEVVDESGGRGHQLAHDLLPREQELRARVRGRRGRRVGRGGGGDGPVPPLRNLTLDVQRTAF